MKSEDFSGRNGYAFAAAAVMKLAAQLGLAVWAGGGKRYESPQTSDSAQLFLMPQQELPGGIKLAAAAKIVADGLSPADISGDLQIFCRPADKARLRAFLAAAFPAAEFYEKTPAGGSGAYGFSLRREGAGAEGQDGEN